MATRYVWSGATGSGTGADWTNAYTTLSAAVTAAAAGDDIRVAHDHNETASSSAAVTYTLAGTRTSPVQVICVDRTTGTVTTGGLVKTVGAYNFTLTQSTATGGSQLRGVTIKAGETGASAKITLTRALWARDCTFEIASTSSGSIDINNPSEYLWENCTVKLGLAGHSINIGAGAQNGLVWRGGGTASGTASTLLFLINYQVSYIDACALDLSSMPAGASIFSSAWEGCNGTLRDSKLPVGWSGSLHSGAVPFGCRFGMYNCDSGDTNYNLIIADYSGTIVDETAIYRTDGFKLRDQSNAAIGYSLKLTTNASANEVVAPLRTDALIRNHPGTSAEQASFTPGTSKTVSVEIAHSAAAALTDADIWLEVDYLGTDGSPLGVIARNRRISTLSTAATHASSAAAWSGTAQTYRQRLSVTINPQAPGVIEARVCLATGNGVVVYVDPMITVS